jgi:hypothetical protein
MHRARPGRSPDPPEIREAKLAARNKRPNAKYRKKAEPEPVSPAYPPGYFTELIRRHDWPPSFEPMQHVSSLLASGMTLSEQASALIERGRAQGRGYASGTIPLTRTPLLAQPLGWIK